MKQHDLIVIGAGPGGYVAAIRAAQLGFDVACIDGNAQLGGTCLRVGCIPSKAMLESTALFLDAKQKLGDHGIRIGEVQLDLAAMLKRKDQVVKTLTRGIEALFRKHKITRYYGHARLDGPERVVVEPITGQTPAPQPDSTGQTPAPQPDSTGQTPAPQPDSTGQTPAPQPDSTGQMPVPQPSKKMSNPSSPAPHGTETLTARHILIATGSKAATLPRVEFDGDRICTSTEALSWQEVPGHLVVIGAGYIGLELGSVWSRLGAKVTVLEYMDRILPGMDTDLANEALKLFRKQGLEFQLGSKVTAARPVDQGCVIECEGREPIDCHRVLVAVGRVPNTDGLGLETVDIQLDDRGRIPVDERFATSAPGIFAVGDVIRGPMLAHKAEEEGIACVEYLATGHGHINYDAIPAVVYTHPEIASVGRTEEELKSAGVQYRKGIFPFRGNGRARTLGDVDGQIKMLSDAETDRLLGVHIIGPRAGDLIAEAAVAIAFEATSEDIARCSHAHPTLAEALKEAALAVDDRAIHA
jgi:dihydrolipoamide dehydrogenase